MIIHLCTVILIKITRNLDYCYKKGTFESIWSRQICVLTQFDKLKLVFANIDDDGKDNIENGGRNSGEINEKSGAGGC